MKWWSRLMVGLVAAAMLLCTTAVIWLGARLWQEEQARREKAQGRMESVLYEDFVACP